MVNLKKFYSHLENLTSKLAEYIVKDGEGASKFLKIKIKGAKTIENAKENKNLTKDKQSKQQKTTSSKNKSTNTTSKQPKS